MRARAKTWSVSIRNDLKPVYGFGEMTARGYVMGPRGTEYSVALELDCDQEFAERFIAWMRGQGMDVPDLPARAALPPGKPALPADTVPLGEFVDDAPDSRPGAKACPNCGEGGFVRGRCLACGHTAGDVDWDEDGNDMLGDSDQDD